MDGGRAADERKQRVRLRYPACLLIFFSSEAAEQLPAPSPLCPHWGRFVSHRFTPENGRMDTGVLTHPPCRITA